MYNSREYRAFGVAMSVDEHHALLKLRRDAISDVAAQQQVLFGPTTILPWGSKAFVRDCKRQRDGSLTATIRITVPDLRNAYTRRVRVQKRQPLRYDSTSH